MSLMASTDGSLIERLERARSPSRAVDVEIYRAAVDEFAAPFKQYVGMVWKNATDGRYVPRYTASIDEALSLVPQNWDWSIDYEPWLKGNRRGPIRAGFATCASGDLNNPKTKQTTGRHDLPAIALCIAALKALEASHG